MNKRRKIPFFTLTCCLLLAVMGFYTPLHAAERLGVNIKVVLADRNSTEIDPEVREMAAGLQGVLKYTGFHLVKDVSLNLAKGAHDEVTLPPQRKMHLQFKGYEGQHARLKLSIIEHQEEIFQTTVLLVDGGSVLIGGPPLEGGVLILKVGGKFCE